VGNLPFLPQANLQAKWPMLKLCAITWLGQLCRAVPLDL
jgi:hypothetical protein